MGTFSNPVTYRYLNNMNIKGRVVTRWLFFDKFVNIKEDKYASLKKQEKIKSDKHKNKDVTTI